MLPKAVSWPPAVFFNSDPVGRVYRVGLRFNT